MSQFFSFSRFLLLISKHWADNKRRYLLAVIGFVLLLTGWFTFTMLVSPAWPMNEEVQVLTFLFTLFGVGGFYASQYFRDLGSRSRGINFLMVPASSFEKVLCAILFTVVIFFVVFTVAFYLVDIFMVAISNQFLKPEDPDKRAGVINIFRAAILPSEGVSAINVILVYFAVQSGFLLGSVYFSKYSFIKTVITGFVIFFTFFCLIYVLYEYLMPKGEYVNGFLTSFRINTSEGSGYLVKVPGWVDQLIYIILMYTITPYLWVVTYYRLKEKQV